MKRLVIGIIVLSFLLCSGVAVSLIFARAHAPVADLLQQAAHAAMEENWADAAACFTQAQARWQRFRDFTAAFADHAPMDEADGLFAQLEIYKAEENDSAFPALCARLAQLVEAVSDSHRLCWWTLL